MSDDLDEIVDNLKEPSAWIRIVFMVGFTLVLYLIVAPIVLVLMIVQALFSVLTGETNYNLRRFGKAIAEYVQQILHFISYNSNDKPFPFSEFPALEEDERDNASPGQSDKGGQDEAAATTKPAPKKAAKAAKKTSKKSATAKKPARKKAAKKAKSESDSVVKEADTGSQKDEGPEPS